MQSLLTIIFYIFCTLQFVQSSDNEDEPSPIRFAFTASWIINNISGIINARVGERFESDEFDLGNATWQILSFPNGNDNTTEGSYMIFLTLLEMSQQWKSVTVRLTILSPQTFSRLTRIVTYDKPKGLGWRQKSLLLQELKDKNFDKLRWFVDIQILRVISSNDKDEILYQHQLPYKNKYRIEWNVNSKELIAMKDASKGKVFEMHPYDAMNRTMWTIRVLPDGKDDGYMDVYLVLFALPMNIWSIKVKYTLSCLETGTSSTYISYFSYLNSHWIWGSKLLSFDQFKDDVNDTATFVADIEVLHYFDRDGYEVVTMAHVIQLKQENNELKRTIEEMEEKMNVLVDRVATLETMGINAMTNLSAMSVCV